jgi:hypothetical protein
VAPKCDIGSIKNWHYNHGGLAIVPDEQEYLDHENDLICVAHKNKTPLRKLIDKIPPLRNLGVWKKKDENHTPDYDKQNVSYYSDERLDGFVSAFWYLLA